MPPSAMNGLPELTAPTYFSMTFSAASRSCGFSHSLNVITPDGRNPLLNIPAAARSAANAEENACVPKLSVDIPPKAFPPGPRMCKMSRSIRV